MAKKQSKTTIDTTGSSESVGKKMLIGSLVIAFMVAVVALVGYLFLSGSDRTTASAVNLASERTGTPVPTAARTLTLTVPNRSKFFPESTEEFAGTYVLRTSGPYMAWVKGDGDLGRDGVANSWYMTWNPEKNYFDLLLPGQTTPRQGYVTLQDKVYFLANNVFSPCTDCQISGNRVFLAKP